MRKTQSYSKHFLTFKNRLAEYHQEARLGFENRHPKAAGWLKQRNVDIGTIRQQSQRLLTGATLSSLLLLATPQQPQLLTSEVAQQKLARAYLTGAGELKNQLAKQLKELLPNRIGHPDPEDEDKIQQMIEDNLGIKAKFELEGQRLNHSLGWIGYEQHLPRFPGDSVRLHDEWQEAGITPGLGAWGYFANSSSVLTKDLELKEKYYAVVQTLYLPTWQQNLKFLRDWYKYRKVLIVNVVSGAAVVADIADAGPANFTGKQFGGSPEVMHDLGLGGGPRKGKVLLLFVDDREDKIPLGPVKEPINIAQAEEV